MRIEAIVIKKLDQGEHGEIIQLYTKSTGKVVALAKGLKRKTSKQAAHLEPFNLIDCRLIAGNGLPIIASAHSRASFPDLKTSLPKLALGFYLLELIDQLIYENEADAALWHWLKERLTALEQMAAAKLAGSQEALLSTWRNELLGILGYHTAGASTVGPTQEYVLRDLVNRPAYALQFARRQVRDSFANELR